MPKFKKGSKEAKEWGKRMQQLRKNKAKKGSGFLDDLTDIGNKMGEPYKQIVGINPFSAGYTLGHDYIAPALMNIKK